MPGLNRSIRSIAAIAFAALLTGCQPPRQVEDRLLLAFGDAMFDRGARDVANDDGAGMIVRFPRRIRASVSEGATDGNVALARAVVAEFGELTGVEIEWQAAGTRDAELTINFSSKSNFLIRGNELATCYAEVASRDDGIIESAAVHIARASEDEWRSDCLVHELMHAFGWRGHTHRIRSANSYLHGETELTEWDRLLMRTLYDPRLEPGTPEQDALPTARLILGELLAAR